MKERSLPAQHAPAVPPAERDDRADRVVSPVTTRELDRAARGMLDDLRRRLALADDDALEAIGAATIDWEVEQVASKPLDQITNQDIAFASMCDPEAGARLKRQIEHAAVAELRSGERAARALEGPYRGTYWQRTQFLSLRRELEDGLGPTTGIERQLLDTLAQALTQQEHWLGVLSLRQLEELSRERQQLEARGGWLPPRVTDAAAIEQAALMVERWNRMVVRSVRTLRELRRAAPAVHIGHVTQANIAHHQIVAECPCAPERDLPESA